MKKKRFVRSIALDTGLVCAALMVFALFHHVLPRPAQSLDIEIQRPALSGILVTDESMETAPPVMTADEGEAAVRNTLNGETDMKDTADAVSSATEAERPRAPQTADAGHSVRSGRTRAVSGGTGGERSGSRKRGSSEKGGSALSPGGTLTSEAAETDAKTVESHFSDTTVITADSYTSPDVSITVSENTLRDGAVTYYLADIWVRDITSLRTAFAGDTFGSGYREEISDMAAAHGALIAVNGDYYGNTTEGVVIRNGVIYRANPTDCDVCVLFYDGSMRVMAGADFSADEAVADGAWQAWTFGPALLDADGSALTAFSSTRRIASANPRTAIGYYEPGHYCLVVVDGRGDSAGISLADLSALFEEMGCRAAYNLDGGNSSVMVWNGSVINDPSGGGRASSDALMIVEANVK